VVELHAGDAEAVVDVEGGGRLARLRVGGYDLLTSEGSFVMAPWAGRTGYGRFTFDGVEHRLAVPAKHAPHAIHGTVRDRRWIAHETTDQAVHLSVDLGPEWPWPGRCEQRIELTGHELSLELTLRTEGPAFPAVVGWHPWFTKPDSFELAAEAMLERGDDHLPTGRRLPAGEVGSSGDLDDCFEGVRWPVVVHWAQLSLSIDATGCDHLVVFDQPADATCVEPQTGPPDGLTTGEHAIVTPEQPLVASTTWRWERP
jgi:aldose 1-epimerase